MKLVRKIYSLIICLALILASISFSSSSAAAAEDDSLKCIDVLVYDYPDDSTSVRGIMSPTKPYNVFDLPFSYGLVFYDVIFETSVSVSSAGMRSLSSGSFYSLTMVSLGSNRYRCYGHTSAAFNSLKFGFQVNSSVTSDYSVTYYKFDVYTVLATGIGDIGEMNITPNADTSVSTNYWYRQSSPGAPIVQDFFYFSSGVQFFDYNVLFSSVNWRQYDYLDFTFQISASTIEYISAYIKTSDNQYRYLPFEISFLNGTAIDKNEYVGSGTATVIPGSAQWDIIMRVYIPSSYRLSGSLFIDVGGQYHNPVSRAFLQSVVGYYYTTVPSPDLTKLDQITAAIKESLSSSEEDNAAAEDFSQNMTSQKEQMAANQQTLNNVSKPSSNDLGMMVAPDSVLDSNGMTALVSIINPITDHKYILGILTLSATLALVSYVFFGKKR